jgi:hypothetical protein
MATTANTKKELALFQFTQPDLLDGMGATQKESTNGAKSITLTLESRKLVAARLGLTPNKDNAERIDAEILRMKDAMKTVGIAEMVKMSTSQNWTGGALRISQNKAGDKQRATFTMVSVDRTGRKLSEEQIVKALASMTDEQRTAILGKAETQQAGEPAIEMETV